MAPRYQGLHQLDTERASDMVVTDSGLPPGPGLLALSEGPDRQRGGESLQRLDEDRDLGIGQPVVALPPGVLHHEQPAGDQLVKMAAGGRRTDFRHCGQPAGGQRLPIPEGYEHLAPCPVGDERPDAGQTRRLDDEGFHAGELAVQHRAGVEAQAARLVRMLEPVELDGGIARFLSDRTFAALTGRDRAGRLWVTPLTGCPGFLSVTSATTLQVSTTLPADDPLHGLPADQPVGMVVVEFAARRRVRINGTLIQSGQGLLVIEVEQAYGNCPQYIQQRVLIPGYLGQAEAGDMRHSSALSSEDIELIRDADTFFLGTTHPERGSDASHRGGPPGFVRVDGNQLWWPDYAGNNMFNSFGNLAIDPETALLFLDFTTGRTLQLAGTAEIEWGEPGRPGDDGHTGRRVRFMVQQLVAGRLLAARQTAYSPYPRNPGLTG